MFRPRYRRPPLTDPLSWTDYRWETGPWHRAAAAGPWAHRRSRRHPLLVLLLAGLAAILGARLVSSLPSRSGSWARRGLYAAVLLVIAGAFFRQRRRW